MSVEGTQETLQKGWIGKQDDDKNDMERTGVNSLLLAKPELLRELKVEEGIETGKTNG